MRETEFIKQNLDKWEQLENVMKEKKKDPDVLSRLFIQVTDDLSFSRTFYKNRSVKFYLNNLSQAIFRMVYKQRNDGFKKFTNFWSQDLPTVMYQSRYELLVSFLIFSLAVAIGIFSTIENPDFTRTILGDDYVYMTEENISKEDPMAVYKKMNQVDMTLGITINNLLVAFRTFALGALWLVGCVAILFYNGVMVGTFQYFFVQRGLFQESFLTIWMHGTLEISAIILAGAAGLVMGKGLVFPGTYSRLYAFQLSAKKGIKIMLGITPIFVAAAFIEGFITRYTELPDAMRLTLILASFAFIFLYFVLYPFKVGHNSPEIKEKPINFDPNLQKIANDEVYINGTIFIESFRVYRIFGGKLFSMLSVSAALHAALVTFIWLEDLKQKAYMAISVDWFAETITRLFDYQNEWILAAISTPFLLFNLLISSFFLHLSIGNGTIDFSFSRKQFLAFLKKNWVKGCIIAIIFHVFFFFNKAGSLILLFMVLPFLLVWHQENMRGKTSVFKSLSHTLDLVFNQYLKTLGLQLILVITGCIFILIVDSPLIWFYLEIINWNLALEEQTKIITIDFLLLFTIIFSLNTIMPLLIFGNAILTIALKEIKSAKGLKGKIENIGKKQKIKGLVLEKN